MTSSILLDPFHNFPPEKTWHRFILYGGIRATRCARSDQCLYFPTNILMLLYRNVDLVIQKYRASHHLSMWCQNKHSSLTPDGHEPSPAFTVTIYRFYFFQALHSWEMRSIRLCLNPDNSTLLFSLFNNYDSSTTKNSNFTDKASSFDYPRSVFRYSLCCNNGKRERSSIKAYTIITTSHLLSPFTKNKTTRKSEKASREDKLTK